MISMRFDAEGIRFRVTPEELGLLLKGQDVVQRIVTGTGSVEYSIKPVAEGDMRMAIEGMRFTLSVSRSSLERLRDLGRSKKGIAVKQGNADISLQVDMKTQPNRAA